MDVQEGRGSAFGELLLRTVFSWSCQQLSEPTARMFRLLSVHPGPDITVPAAASLAGVPPCEARQALADLARAHLTTQHAPGRYACHDLLRAYAAEQAASDDSDATRRAAVDRILDHYLHTARTAALLLHPMRGPITLDPPRPLVRPEELTGRQQALEWFQAERQVLLAAISQAADSGSSAHAWQLPWAAAAFFGGQGYWQELETTAALELGRRLGSSIVQARVHLGLAWVADMQGRDYDALSHSEQALCLFRAAGHLPGEASGLSAVGWAHAQLGGYLEALEYCGRGLALHRDLQDRPGEADTLDSLGYAHHCLGHYAEAIACYQQAIDVHGEAGDLCNRAEILTHLGDAHQAAGDPDAARRAWQQAQAILDNLHHPDASQVRDRLGKPGTATTGSVPWAPDGHRGRPSPSTADATPGT